MFHYALRRIASNRPPEFWRKIGSFIKDGSLNLLSHLVGERVKGIKDYVVPLGLEVSVSESNCGLILLQFYILNCVIWILHLSSITLVNWDLRDLL